LLDGQKIEIVSSVMKSFPNFKSTIVALGALTLIPAASHAQLIFTAGNQTATQVTPYVNNLIDLNLADFTNNVSGQTLTGYTTTTGQNITGSMTRSNLTQGSLLTVTQMNAAIASSMAANQLAGVVNFTGGTGSIVSNSFTGTNSTGNITFTSNIAFASAQVVSRAFNADLSNGPGNTNSAPINNSGFLNINSTTWTLSTAVDYVGFTALQRDGSRSYTWSVRITDGVTPITISLGGISTAGMNAATVAGDANASNYRYDTFVGYQAPTGFKVDQIILGGGFMNVDSFTYAMIPEPSTAGLLGLGVIGMILARRRKA
jgi:hypothetical protein